MKEKFPSDFLWGAATSSHQVEGDNFYNDWWKWEETGCLPRSEKACDQYNRFREDFRIAKELGHNAHRLGLEWSRLEKEEGKWDEKEWSHYREVVDELVSLGIEPVVTLNHFTLPLWLAQKGGWEDPKIAAFFARYAEKAVMELGDRVKCWITLNEPLVLAFIAYFQGKWPPFQQSFDKMLLVAKNMLKSHVEAYHSMKEVSQENSDIKQPKIGLAINVATFHPCFKFSLFDRMSAYLRGVFQNHGFIKSAISGRASLFPYVLEKLPYKNTLDFIGLNYYFREFVHYKKPFFKNPFGWVCSKAHHYDAGKRTLMGWEVYPRGLYEIVMNFKSYGLPIFVTENGISTYDDAERRDYIKEHLRYVLKAISEGAPVIGYLHWSLLDNFEWSDGYTQKFGLVEVDFKTQERRIRESARYYSSVIKSGEI